MILLYPLFKNGDMVLFVAYITAEGCGVMRKKYLLSDSLMV